MKPALTVLAVSALVALTGCHNNAGAPGTTQGAGQVLSESESSRRAEKKSEIAPLDKVVAEQIVREATNQPATAALQKAVPAQSMDAAQYHASQPVGVVTHLPFVDTDRENYDDYDDNAIRLTSEQPVSTFSIDVDTASYSNVRRMIAREGRLPPRDAVRVEEMINYFSYNYETPGELEAPFAVTTQVAPSPWNPGRHILQVGLKGYVPEYEKRPPANLVFLVDVSGSMMDPDKLPLVKKSLRLLVNQMNADDRIALAVYAGAAGLVLDSTPGNERGKILAAIEQLQAGGSTNGSAGLQLAYDVAAQNQLDGGINRVIITSDGDMNVGITDQDALKDLISIKRKQGIALTTLGFGTGNYNYALMEQLADVGDGNAAYIDSVSEAHKVLVNEMQSTLLTIARDVKIQIEFNPALVAEYRLVGYENRMLNREDFRNDKVDAGDIGAGHTVTAFYELALVRSSGTAVPGLRYGQGLQQPEPSALPSELAYVRIRYKDPHSSLGKELESPVLASQIRKLDDLSADMKFAAAVAGYGQLLRGGKYLNGFDLETVVELARQGRGVDDDGYRGEFIQLVQLTRSLGLGG